MSQSFKQQQEKISFFNHVLKSPGSGEVCHCGQSACCVVHIAYVYSVIPQIIPCAVCTETSLPLQQKAPDPVGLDEWPFQCAARVKKTHCYLESKIEVPSSNTDISTPLNNKTNPLLSESIWLVLLASLAEVALRIVDTEKWLDFINNITSIDSAMKHENVIHALKCNQSQSYRASIKSINRVPKVIYWFCISYAVISQCYRFDFC